MITVTKVHVTPDLSLAKVYLSLFAVERKRNYWMKFKNITGKSGINLVSALASKSGLYRNCNFILDDSLDYIENIERLLDE